MERLKIDLGEQLGELEEERAEKIAGDYYIRDDKTELLVCGQCKSLKERLVLGVVRPYSCNCELTEKIREYRENDPVFQQEKRIILERQRKHNLLGEKFENYCLENDDNSNPKISKLVKSYIYKFAQIKKKNIGLLFYGDVGTGKTFYAVSIANELFNQGRYALVTNIPTLINELQNSSFDRLETQKTYDRISNCQLLVIDDLAVESDSNYRKELTYNIIDTRYRSNKPVIVTTNLDIQDMKNETELSKKRIFDRVLEMTVPIKISGKSKRIKPVKNKQADLIETLGLIKRKEQETGV